MNRASLHSLGCSLGQWSAVCQLEFGSAVEAAHLVLRYSARVPTRSAASGFSSDFYSRPKSLYHNPKLFWLVFDVLTQVCRKVTTEWSVVSAPCRLQSTLQTTSWSFNWILISVNTNNNNNNDTMCCHRVNAALHGPDITSTECFTWKSQRVNIETER